ncbi:NAD(P)-binding protein [Punctularia strigosozonata HHB-11173 SS5]|uniref:NAD(P)-binding protein n=1 Tax=Punctularia strigosozonata (strain HHB-11173) TaxID=741275 RepID=R7S2B1_PUNST|nr:NAD(P)-binding protein [Punctularia strigosozonata HHB-11173 SS5]EIN03917.1 NAD(P)-binding protein [Punctularia strigosozonata HHB-11173 SS5]
MSPTLFLTGTTGYIGGTVLDTLYNAHPEWSYIVLLRKVPDGFEEKYPNVQIVKGDYDSIEVISQAASRADIVVHSGNSDHEPSINALIAGLLKRPKTSFLIHLSGTGIVADFREGKYVGELNPKVWSDIEDIDAITSLPDDALHRNVDKIIQAAAAAHGDKLKTAIVCPPDICGKGRGLGRTQSVLLPAYKAESIKLGAAVYTGSGGNARSWVHIEDLMKLYLSLVEAAAAGGGNADWGKEGYYFASTHESTQYDLAKASAKCLHAKGLILSPEPKQLSIEEIDGLLSDWKIPGIARYLFAGNSRTRPDRATKLFGYTSTAPTLWDVLEADFDSTNDPLVSAALDKQ